jgi:hypothetical protein
MTVQIIPSKYMNKKSLAAAVGVSPRILNNEIRSMLSDQKIAREFGSYKYRRFTLRQLQIMKQNIAILENIQIE